MGISIRCCIAITIILIICTFITYLCDEISVTPQSSAGDPGRQAKKTPPVPDDSYDNLFWFVQITDLHISRFYDPRRKKLLKDFCQKDLALISPDVTLVTGDLTDAKHANNQGSEQYIDEWQDYNRIITESGILNKTVWLDIRGNHDAFNVPYLNSDLNYFKKFSHQGKKHLSSYHYTHKKKFGRYSFIGVDACPVPGPKRPFNFFGMVSANEFESLTNYKLAADASNVTIWFGHYPTSVIHSPAPGIRHLMRDSSAYLCGHLHTLGGLVPNMYAKQKSGNLELELGDWKDNRMFRLLVIDHDLLSFVDQKMGTWPIIIVSNPKHALYSMPSHEPVGRMLHSTHIRVLVFSPAHIEYVHISIDSVFLGEGKRSGGPLYTLRWDPQSYASGIHQITISVKDEKHGLHIISQPFSLDNTSLSFSLFPRLILMWNMSTLCQLLFWSIWLFSFLPLVILRFLHIPILVPSEFSGCLVNFLQNWMNRFYLLTATNRIFWPLAVFHVYIAVGPWFIGRVLDEFIGVCFVFGLYVDGQLLPSHSTYAYGFLFILFFNIPLILLLGMYLERAATPTHDSTRTRCASKYAPHRLLIDHWAMTLLLIIQCYCAVTGFYWAYGTMAFLLGPLKTWSVILQLTLWFLAARGKPVATVSNGLIIIPAPVSGRTSRPS
ncbi:transmembrane protein 62-like [Tubulanus polymorphus]|uniref:transmembrane protein 62-like n=1 Tax=Tubulanus polymorphus TaxID=672921 RepID=UPI003DA665F6